MGQFRSWDELSELEQLQCIYSDDYKDVYGFRPRLCASKWNDVQWLKDQLNSLENVDDAIDNRRH